MLEVSIWRRRGRLGHGVQVPLPVLFQRVQQLLSIWMNQVGPRFPQRVDDVVDEAHLGKKKKMKILQILDEATLMLMVLKEHVNTLENMLIHLWLT